jgi:hypothetical protein
MRRLLPLGLVAAAVLAGCARGAPPPLEPLENAARAVDSGSTDGNDLALAAWHAWLAKSDGAALKALAERAVEADPASPWARLARAEAARRELDDAGEAEALLALAERAPDHALAVVAAGRLAALAGTAAAIDDALARRVPPILENPDLPVETRVRLALVLRELALARGEDPAPAVQAAGLVNAAAIVGPFSAYRALDAGRPFPPETGPVEASYRGPPGIGAVSPRPFSLPGGTLSLEGEPWDGDVYYALAVAEVARDGAYAVRFSSPRGSSTEVRLDGVPVLRRDVSDGSPLPHVVAGAVELKKGRHLLSVKLVRGHDRGVWAVSLLPFDPGHPAVTFRAAAPGDAPGQPPKPLFPDRTDDGPALALGADGKLLGTLLADAGAAGLYAAAHDALGRDVEGAKDLLAGTVASLPRSAPLFTLAADVALADPTFPGTLARARASTALEEALRRDPRDGRALLGSAMLLREAGRYDDALGRIEEADGAAPGRATVAVARARIEATRGFDVLALTAAREAERREAGRCAAGSTLYELSLRADAAADVEAAIAAYASCPGGVDRRISLLRSRGRLEEALVLAEADRARNPQGISEAYRVADLLLALGRPADGARTLAALEASWPRWAGLSRRRAELLELAGDRSGAAAARDRALQLEGGDLALRRLAARERGGELLGELARDGREVIRAFERSGKKFDTRAVVVLDHAAAEVYADGSAVQRVHSIVQVLDKRGIDEYAEVQLPSGAEVLVLRTVKRDGRLLEPESIAGKESVSLPGLEVGDYVETEYLVPIPARTPALPGWSLPAFYFRTPDDPLVESTYVIRADARAGLDLDLFGVEPDSRTEKDGWITVTFRRTDVPAHVGEPRSPGRDEFLPWARAGAGAGEEAIAAYLGDTLADDAAPTREIRTFAREAVQGAPAADRRARVRAVYDRVMETITGNGGGWGVPASHVLATQRGNRLLLLRASLAALGIESRYAVLRGFEENPRDSRFPELGRWSAVVLTVDLGGETLWLDPALRWAPFGEVRPSLRGQPGFLLPAPGDDSAAVRRVTAPAPGETPLGRRVEVALEVAENGDVRGEGVERHFGYDGARARNGLENLDPDRRRQTIEASLGRSFRGLVLEELEVEAEGPPGTPVTVRYRFHAPGLARPLGNGRLGLEGFFAADLGRKFLARGARETPLLVSEPERRELLVRLVLPAGTTLHGLPDAEVRSAFGAWVRTVRPSAGGAEIREELSLERRRVLPEEYPAFARWVTAVDRGQATEAIVGP